MRAGWVSSLSGYDGLFYLGYPRSESYRGYVVRTSSDPEIWFAYTYSDGKHSWLSEGSRDNVMQDLERTNNESR